ncbi:MAG: hypothetical protein ACKVJF_12755 [Flavobacteriales bacterium]
MDIQKIEAGLFTLSFLLSVNHLQQSEVPKEKDAVTIPKPKIQIKNQKEPIYKSYPNKQI